MKIFEKSKLKIIQKCYGQSLIEVVVAMAIFALISASLISMILGGLNLLSEGGNLIQVGALGEEGLEAVRAIKNRAWNELVVSQSAIQYSINAWTFAGEASSEQIGIFSRNITLSPVYRDGDGKIVLASDPDAELDLFSKLVETEITWTTNRGNENSRSFFSLLSNWDSFDWAQSDWSGGEGQTTWSDETMFDSEDGNIEFSNPNILSLKEISTSTFAASGWLESSEFFVSGANSFNIISWKEDWDEACSVCAVEIQIKTAEDSFGNPVNWSADWSGPDGEDGDESDFFDNSSGGMISTDHNEDEWIKYRITFTGEEEYSPTVSEVRINYQE